MNNVVDDRTVLEVCNVQYVACIVPDEWQENPLTDWDQAVSFFVPSWGAGNSAKHISGLLNGEMPNVSFERVSNALYERTMNASWYEKPPASEWLKLFRAADPSGIYLLAHYDEDRYSGPAIHLMPDDWDNDVNYVIVYVTSDTIRTEWWNVKRITQAIRDNVRGVIESTLQTFNAWANGEVFAYELLRQELDDDGETISSEEVNLWELGGDLSPTIYGYDGISELYEAAQVNAEYDHAAREATASHAMQSMDLFDAASYPEPTMSDVAGAYEARLNEQFAELRRVTRKLAEEGYHRGHGVIAIG